MARLLMVDTRHEICEVIAAFCAEQGYTTTIAGDAASAREALEREKFDCLIIDVVLPGESGLTLAGVVAARGISVVLISGQGRLNDFTKSPGTRSCRNHSV